MGQPSLPPARPRRPRVDPARSAPPAPPASSPLPEAETPSWWQSAWKQAQEHLAGTEGKSYGSSLLVHLVLLSLLLAFPVYTSLTERDDEITTIVSIDPVEEMQFDGPVTTEIIAPLDLEEPLAERPDQLFSAVTMESTLPDLVSANLTGGTGGAGGEGPGEGAGHGTGLGGLGAGGIRIAEPGNAIRAGNFSVWCWPIIGKELTGKILHDDPGAAPKVYQDYHIVIRIRVPGDRRTINLSDFSGDVVGTDKYFQKIPEDAYFFNNKGELLAARTGRPIPVIEGTAELLVRVPGASSAAVKDTIRVRSKILNEEQKIELVFASRD